MIIYGYKHFVDRAAYEASPVAELGRLYKLVNQLVEYHAGLEQLPGLREQLDAHTAAAQANAEALAASDKPSDKATKKARRRLDDKVASTREDIKELEKKLAAVDNDSTMAARAADHPNIGAASLQETALLHAGDATNRQLWEEFLPACRQAIERIYERINVTFDYQLGESFYQDRLADVVGDFESRGLAEESEGAMCIFLDEFETPMIIRKKDGAFLYATTDLATIQYRVQEWQVDEILYVVDHRQSEHFSKLFAAVGLWNLDQVKLRHIPFGTVLGKDGKPFKTRSGATVGLENLLDEAVQRARTIVADNDDAKKNGAELDQQERDRIADVIGHAAIKYADLSHNRTSDYVFDEEKMVAMQGNTATYMQYSFARVNGIFRKGNVDIAALHRSNAAIQLDDPHERALTIALLKFSDALAEAVDDFRPNVLTGYLYELTKVFSGFFEHCHVLKAEKESTRDSRLLLCDLTGRTIRKGLSLLGIDVVERM
jgi:arginyl-tRNA synthetase